MVRCPECYTKVVDQLRIPPMLRGRQLVYPASYDALPPWPVDDAILVPASKQDTFEAFRFMAWRSLAPHRASPQCRAIALPFQRLLDVSLDKDPAITMSMVADAAVLVLTVLGTEMSGDWASNVLRNALWRPNDGRGVWIFSEITASRLGEKFGYAVQDALPRPVRILSR